MSKTRFPPEWEACSDCTVPGPPDWNYCKHCGRPQRFPNVNAASAATRRAALRQAYEAARQAIAAQGNDAARQQFEDQCNASVAVLCTSVEKLEPMLVGHRDLLARFDEVRLLRFDRPPGPGAPNWVVVRAITEIALFQTDKYPGNYHYAALSLDQKGLPHYGPVEIVLRTSMIAHRASLFRENSGWYVELYGPKLPADSQCRWEDRGQLCVVKHASALGQPGAGQPWESLVLKSDGDPSGRTDVFVEVQIFGELTLHACERVTLYRDRLPTEGRRKHDLATGRGGTRLAVMRERAAEIQVNGQPLEFQIA